MKKKLKIYLMKEGGRKMTDQTILNFISNDETLKNSILSYCSLMNKVNSFKEIYYPEVKGDLTKEQLLTAVFKTLQEFFTNIDEASKGLSINYDEEYEKFQHRLLCIRTYQEDWGEYNFALLISYFNEKFFTAFYEKYRMPIVMKHGSVDSSDFLMISIGDKQDEETEVDDIRYDFIEKLEIWMQRERKCFYHVY
jgi:hypothetical protein